MTKQGAQANNTGNLLERTVKNICQEKGFQIVKYSVWVKNPDKYGGEVLLTGAPYQSVYNHRGTTEFLLISQIYGLHIRIECKWQQVSGSVDEKLPYLYLNCIEAMPEDRVIIIIDGGGWKAGAVEWLRNAVEEKKYTDETNRGKVIQVFSLTQFMTWANKTFKG